MSSDEGEYEEAKFHDFSEVIRNQKTQGMFISGWDDDKDEQYESQEPIDDAGKRLLWAAESGILEIVQEIVSTNHSVICARDDDGYTALHRACYSNHVDIVKYLIEKNADIEALTNDDWRPLHSACIWNNVYCAVRLIEAGADINATTKGGQTPLHLAAQHGKSSETLELLLNHPLINHKKKNNAGDTAYDVASRNGIYHKLFEIVEDCINLIPDNR